MKHSMLKPVLPFALLTATLVACAPGDETTMNQASGDVVSLPSFEFRDSMRELWSDHVIWTRAYIIAAVDADSSAAAAAERLMRNQEEIGAAVAPYYGDDAGNRLTALLKEHITIAVDLIAAAKAGDNAKQTRADSLWHTNARDLAQFLSNANPSNWTNDALLGMLNEHLALTTTEVVNRLQRKWADDVATFDRIHDQALMMADALSDGIMKQFPTRF